MLYILPGMGADSRMYGDSWKELANAEFLDWPSYNGEKTFTEVAQRIIKLYNISSSDAIAGSSLGGMISLEIAAFSGIKEIYLIGSAINKEEINPLLRLLTPAADITPIKFIQIITKKYPNNIMQMFTKADSGFIRSMCKAIAKWQGFYGTIDSVVRIHGKKDMVIACPGNSHGIQNGGHLIAITHANECVEILKQYGY